MASVISWNVSQLDCKPKEGEYTDVVLTVYWECNGTEGNYLGRVYSTCSLPAPEGAFTPYQDLTLDQVLGWIWSNGVDKAATEANVQNQIDQQINPPIVSPSLPWAQGAPA
jgi:hypothetical protein